MRLLAAPVDDAAPVPLSTSRALERSMSGLVTVARAAEAIALLALAFPLAQIGRRSGRGARSGGQVRPRTGARRPTASRCAKTAAWRWLGRRADVQGGLRLGSAIRRPRARPSAFDPYGPRVLMAVEQRSEAQRSAATTIATMPPPRSRRQRCRPASRSPGGGAGVGRVGDEPAVGRRAPRLRRREHRRTAQVLFG